MLPPAGATGIPSIGFTPTWLRAEIRSSESAKADFGPLLLRIHPPVTGRLYHTGTAASEASPRPSPRLFWERDRREAAG